MEGGARRLLSHTCALRSLPRMLDVSCSSHACINTAASPSLLSLPIKSLTPSSLPLVSISLSSSAISAVMIAVGVLLVLFGCRLFKATLFTLTLIAISGMTYYIGVQQGQDQRVMLGVALGLGLFCGLLAIKLWKVALFLVGALVGFVLFVIIKSMYPGAFVNPAVMYPALLIPSVCLGLFSVCMERYWLLFATPILGSFLLMQGIDHFANLSINVFGTLAGTARCDSDECYGLWAGVVGLSLVGMLVQYKWTAGFESSAGKTHQKEKYVKQIDSV
jgi:hypothetical protein